MQVTRARTRESLEIRPEENRMREEIVAAYRLTDPVWGERIVERTTVNIQATFANTDPWILVLSLKGGAPDGEPFETYMGATMSSPDHAPHQEGARRRILAAMLRDARDENRSVGGG